MTRLPTPAASKDFTRAGRGEPFEHLITMANAQYAAKGIACVHKVPTAWVPIRRGAEFVAAKVTEKASVDFLGAYRGRPIAFDAKEESGRRISWSRVEPHQAAFMDNWTAAGGVSFVLVWFKGQAGGSERFVLVPWWAWRRGMNGPKVRGSASLLVTDAAEEWEVWLGRGRVMLDYLATLGRIVSGVAS